MRQTLFGVHLGRNVLWTSTFFKRSSFFGILVLSLLCDIRVRGRLFSELRLCVDQLCFCTPHVQNSWHLESLQ